MADEWKGLVTRLWDEIARLREAGSPEAEIAADLTQEAAEAIGQLLKIVKDRFMMCECLDNTRGRACPCCKESRAVLKKLEE